MDQNITTIKLDANTMKETDVTPKTVVSTYIYNDIVDDLNAAILGKQNAMAEWDAIIAEKQARKDRADNLNLVPLVAETL